MVFARAGYLLENGNEISHDFIVTYNMFTNFIIEGEGQVAESPIKKKITIFFLFHINTLEKLIIFIFAKFQDFCMIFHKISGLLQ